jgi:hypothetical protein
VALLLRPARHVLGTDIAGKYLAAADLGQRIVTGRALPLLPSHCSDGTVTLFSIKAASA